MTPFLILILFFPFLLPSSKTLFLEAVAKCVCIALQIVPSSLHHGFCSDFYVFVFLVASE